MSKNQAAAPNSGRRLPLPRREQAFPHTDGARGEAAPAWRGSTFRHAASTGHGLPGLMLDPFWGDPENLYVPDFVQIGGLYRPPMRPRASFPWPANPWARLWKVRPAGRRPESGRADFDAQERPGPPVGT